MQRTSIMRAISALAFAVSASLSSVASAEPNSFVAPTDWSRGQARSTYQEWDVFSSPTMDTPNLPDVGYYNPNAPDGAGLNVYDATQFAWVVGSGNLYSPFATIDVQATVPGYGLGSWYHTIVVAQTQTYGSELDYANITVNGTHAASTTELSRVESTVEFTSEPVYIVGASSVWRLNGNEFNYTFSFPAVGPSSSFDRVAIDMYAVLNGDVNGDQVVDIQDITKIANNWLQTGSTGDANGDGIVDIQDITFVANNWLHSAANAPPAQLPTQNLPVPEPATWALLFSGMAALGVLVRRRGAVDLG